MRRFSHLVRRLKMLIHGKWHWIFPRKGLLYVFYNKKRRPIRLHRGKPQIFYERRWIGFDRRKVPVVMRLRYKGAWRRVVKRRGKWRIYYGTSYRRVKLRGHQFGILISGRWRYLPARGTLQIRYRKMWRRVRNCCNRLRAVLRGKQRRIRLRNGKALVRKGLKWRKISKRYRSRFRLGQIQGRYLRVYI